MSVKKDTIAKYVRHLANFGCVFKIIEDDGTQHGKLEVVMAKTRAKRRSVLDLIDYKTPLCMVGVGDVVELRVPAELNPASMQSAVSGHCATKYGAGKFTSSYNRKTGLLEVMRLEA